MGDRRDVPNVLHAAGRAHQRRSQRVASVRVDASETRTVSQLARLPTAIAHLGETLARAILRRRAVVTVLWIAALVLFAPLAERIDAHLARATMGADGDAAKVSEMLQTAFRSPFAESALLVVSGIPDPRTPAGDSILRRITSAVEGVSGVTTTISYFDAHDPYFLGDDGHSAMVIAGLDRDAAEPETILPRLQELSRNLVSDARTDAPALRLRWTSEALLNREFREISAEQASHGELLALPLTLAVLVVVFGSALAAVCPLVAGATAIPVALGAAAVLATVFPITGLIINVITMIGLALSIDYSLLIIDRFGQAMVSGRDKREAALESALTAGRTVLVSGVAVAVGFAALLAVPVDELRSVAAGGLLATLTAVILSTTLLPVALSYFGGIDFGRFRAVPPSGERRRGWLKWARLVAAHPFIVLVLAGAPVMALASQAIRIEIELPRGDWLPKTAESAQAIQDLRRIGRGTMADGLVVVLETPAGDRIDQAEGWRALETLTAMLAREPRIERVNSLATLPAPVQSGPATAGLLPTSVSRALVSDDRRLALAEAIPAHDLQTFEISRLVRDLKHSIAASPELTGYRVRIGGRSAAEVDYEDAVKDSFVRVIGLVLAGTLAALAIAFRSLLIPLKAVVLNLISVGAGFGAVVLVFQDGYGAALLGVPEIPGAVFPAIPMLVFCAVFGVSMDYEVFLVSRVAEMRRACPSEREAVVQAVAQTGSLITGAAAVMVAVFAAFMLGDLLLMKMLGFALVATVLIDATVVRLAIGPALLTLAGRWNWWPGHAVGARGWGAA